VRSSLKNMFTVITLDQWEQDASKQETLHSLKIWWKWKSMMLLNFLYNNWILCMLLEKKNQCNHTDVKQHKTNLLNLQCDSDSDLKKDNLLSTFKYQILSIKSLICLSSPEQSEKCDCDCSLNSILNRNVRITKKIQKNVNFLLWRLYVLMSEKHFKLLCLILSQHDDTRQNELIMKEDSDMMMNVDESSTHWTVRFADSKKKNKTINKLTSSASKTKNVWLTDIFCCAVEENST
jgi:hypothetical protein